MALTTLNLENLGSTWEKDPSVADTRARWNSPRKPEEGSDRFDALSDLATTAPSRKTTALSPWSSPRNWDETTPASCMGDVQTFCMKDPTIYKPIALNDCNEIIPNLYLGGLAAVSDTQTLVQQGIRAVCCCLREMEFPTSEFCEDDIEYYRVDVEDMGREPIELFFPEATEFIHSWISREQPVLVHCRAGVSRSSTIVIAYLVTYHGYSLYDAFFLVRSHRSVVAPNIAFMEKLSDYEEAKRATESTIDVNKYVGWYTTPERAAVPDLSRD